MLALNKPPGDNMENKSTMYVNLGVLPETRAKFNLLKAQIEVSLNKSVTTDELVNLMLESTSIEILATAIQESAVAV